MFEPQPEPVPDTEVEAVLAAALRTSSGSLTRSAECWMAAIAARHLLDQMVLAGLTVVRYPDRKTT